jgi:hypothetical protein
MSTSQRDHPNGRTRLALMSRQHLVRWALPAVVACLAIAGCGSSASSSSSAAASSTQAAGLSAFQTCLQQHGVKITPHASFSPGASFSPRAFPSGTAFPTAFPGGFPGGGANSAAFKACQKYAPAGFRTGRHFAISASAIAAFKGCMSQNGVKVTSTTFASLAKLRRSSAKAAAAFKICGTLIEQGSSGPTPTPTG